MAPAGGCKRNKRQRGANSTAKAKASAKANEKPKIDKEDPWGRIKSHIDQSTDRKISKIDNNGERIADIEKAVRDNNLELKKDIEKTRAELKEDIQKMRERMDLQEKRLINLENKAIEAAIITKMELQR